MDDLAHAVHVIEANETLSGQLSHKRERYTLIVVTFNDLEEVNSQNFEHHYEMLTIRAMMNEGVQKLHTVRGVSTHAELCQTCLELRIILVEIIHRALPLSRFPVSGYLIKDFNFIIGGLKIMLSALLHLHGNVAIVLKIFGQPDCREMAPTKFLDDHIPVKKDLTNMDRVVATDLIIRHAFVLTGVLILEEALPYLVLKGCEIF